MEPFILRNIGTFDDLSRIAEDVLVWFIPWLVGVYGYWLCGIRMCGGIPGLGGPAKNRWCVSRKYASVEIVTVSDSSIVHVKPPRVKQDPEGARLALLERTWDKGAPPLTSR
jgi:hypothetical protein